jgi:nonribosomal peptide synthetase DhbF
VPDYEDKNHELMAGQFGIWLAQFIGTDEQIYNIGEYLEIQGDLDLRLFEAALRRTVAEADTYHLRFSGDEERPWQRIEKSKDWPLHIIDVSSTADPRASAENWMWADMRRPVDFMHGPLFTYAVFMAGYKRFFYYQRAHHIAVDGISGSILTIRLTEIYQSLLMAREPEGALGSMALP